MKKLIFLLLTGNIIFAQGGGPPDPPGLTYLYAVDYDNDGSAAFPVREYVANTWIPDLEAFSGQSLADYDFVIEDVAGNILPDTFTNATNPQSVHGVFTYNGNGPEYVPVWPHIFSLDELCYLILQPVPFDGDADNDGVSNANEDVNGNGLLYDDKTDGIQMDFMNPDDDGDGIPTINEDYNGNGNPMDDDTNSNGIPDFREAGVALNVRSQSQAQFSIYPNPSHGTVNIGFGDSAGANANVTVYDLHGKEVRKFSSPTGPMQVTGLVAGTYIVKLESQNAVTVRKLIIQ